MGHSRWSDLRKSGVEEPLAWTSSVNFRFVFLFEFQAASCLWRSAALIGRSLDDLSDDPTVTHLTKSSNTCKRVLRVGLVEFHNSLSGSCKRSPKNELFFIELTNFYRKYLRRRSDTFLMRSALIASAICLVISANFERSAHLKRSEEIQTTMNFIRNPQIITNHKECAHLRISVHLRESEHLKEIRTPKAQCA